MRKTIIDMIKTVVDNDEVMSPYEFMSKIHSLSTEDLGKFFIHSIDFSTLWEPFTSNRNAPI